MTMKTIRVGDRVSAGGRRYRVARIEKAGRELGEADLGKRHKFTTRRKNIMRAFTIDELSAVDNPAQAHARVAIMKRHGGNEQENDMRLERIGGDEVANFGTLDEAVEHLRESGMSRSDAMSKAARAHPDLLKQYRDEGEAQVKKQLERMRSPTASPAVGAFDALVRRIRERDMCSGTEALRRARSEDPAAFARYQGA